MRAVITTESPVISSVSADSSAMRESPSIVLPCGKHCGCCNAMREGSMQSSVYQTNLSDPCASTYATLVVAVECVGSRAHLCERDQASRNTAHDVTRPRDARDFDRLLTHRFR
jgi:hypothetical protein